MAIKIFFHICAITRAEQVVNNFIRSIHYSGLYDDAHLIYCYISGKMEIIKKIIDLLNLSGGKFVIVKCVPNDISYERLTLEDIHNHVDRTDQILYIHSKGVSIYHQDSPERLRCIDDWCDVMLYYLIRHYKTCLEYLQTHHTVGVNYKKIGRDGSNSPHWSGNFWWVRGDYFLTLPHIIGPHYYEPEQRFLFVNNPKYFEIYQMIGDTNCYEERYEPFKYIDTKLQ